MVPDTCWPTQALGHPFVDTNQWTLPENTKNCTVKLVLSHMGRIYPVLAIFRHHLLASVGQGVSECFCGVLLWSRLESCPILACNLLICFIIHLHASISLCTWGTIRTWTIVVIDRTLSGWPHSWCEAFSGLDRNYTRPTPPLAWISCAHA